MYEDRQLLDGRITETLTPGGHDAMLRRTDLRDDPLLPMRLQPDRVGEIGRTEFAIALGILTVARGAIVGKELLAGLHQRRVGRRAGETDDIGGNLADFVRLKDIAESRHFRSTRIRIVGKTDAVLHRRIDVVDAAAPHPVIIVEVGITLPAFRART